MEKRSFTVLDEEYYLELEYAKKDVDVFVEKLNISEDEKVVLNNKIERYVTTMFVAMKKKELKKIDAIQHLVNTW